MKSNCFRLSATVGVLVLSCMVAGPRRAEAAKQKTVSIDQIKAERSGGGLVVHVGCGDGRQTAALGQVGHLVQGLDTDAENVANAREHLRSLGQYGTWTAQQFDGRRLPYAEETVNLLVVQDRYSLSDAEILRVLVPGGVARVADGNDWKKLTKPWPAEIGPWSHFLCDASNNAVAQDSRVGPPRRLKWTAGPLWSRSHEFISSIAAMISAGGRIFYVVDEGLTSLTDAPIPERWMLVARDAFNGVMLWKQPLPDWRADEWGGASLRGRPASVPRRLVADDKYLYMTPSHRAGVSVVDPTNARLIREIEGTENAQEMLLVDGTLVVRLAPIGGKRGQPAGGAIAAIDPVGGTTLWKVPVDRYTAQTLAAEADRVVYADGKETICLSLADGNELWRSPSADLTRDVTLIIHDGFVVQTGGPKVVAFSAETGEQIWNVTSKGPSMRPGDVFISAGRVWLSSDAGITGYDLATGRPDQSIDPSSVQSEGHHLRCYRAKATERFLITQFRGAEFVSLTGEDHCQNDWIRGACTYGVMPANGLLYVPPNPCFCYPGAKLTGLNAFSPALDEGLGASDDGQQTPQLQRGPAYTTRIPDPQSLIPSSSDWPTYRHDASRSGATTSEVSPQVSVSWTASLPGKITPPVVAGQTAFVAAVDQHTLYAFSVDDGRPLWNFTAGARIDSPPTVHGPMVLFGSADGHVYCLRASDGELAWRLRAAPQERMIVSFGQLESAWRVHGSILVTDGLAYCTAGRSTFVDGGIRLLAIDPATGRVVHERELYTWSPTRADAEGKPYVPAHQIEGAHSDILVGQGGSVFLSQMEFDLALAYREAQYLMPDPETEIIAMNIKDSGFTISDPDLDSGFESFRGFHRYLEKAHPEMTKRFEETYGGVNLGDRKSGLHLAPTAGFLDDTWFNRTYWMYSSVWPGWYHAHRAAKSGQLLVVGPNKTYALQAFPTRNRQSPLFTAGDKGYLLLADDNDTEPILDSQTRGATKGMGYTRLKPPAWYDWVPVRVRGMVLAGEHLFTAGPPDVVDPLDPMAAFEGRKGAVLQVHSAADGKKLAEHKLDAPPVFDGLIAAGGRLFVSTTDGKLVCLAE